MPAPTFVASYQSVFNDSTTPKTAAPTVAVGDVLAVVGVAEDAGTTIVTPTGGGLTYTLQQSHVTASNCAVYVWTAISASAQSFTLSADEGGDGSAWWGIQALRFSGSDGVGASSKAQSTGATSLGLTTLFANSAVVLVNGDWNAVDGASRTWRTVNSITPTSGNSLERTYFRDAAHYGVYVAYWNDAGAAGANTYGLSAPTGQKYGAIAVEIRGTSAAGTGAFAPTKRPNVGALLQL